MRTIFCALLCACLFAVGCKSHAAGPAIGLTADIHIKSPFAGNIDGKLYLKNDHLHVDAGEVMIFDLARGAGWAFFPNSNRYWDIDWKDVSTFLPRRENGSPCAHSDNPAHCRDVDKETIEGRSATKWEVVNNVGRRVYLWSDDETGIALRWQIETVTYTVDNIRSENLPDDLFALPSDYTHVGKRQR
jgi:hypothetical protein